MNANIGITQKNLQGVNEILTAALSDTVMLYMKARKFHWNVSGNSFMELHKLFEKHYEELDEAMDEIAERISKLGFIVPATLAEFLKLTGIKETPGENHDQLGMITELLKDHETVIVALRKAIDDCEEKFKDKGTADFLTGIMQNHETLAWTLRRYLK
jgi:starvation-inducible DNA-binding protein